MFGYIFTNMLAAAGIAAGWLNPVLGLMVYYAFATLRPTSLWFWSFKGNTTRYSFFIGLSTLLGWALEGFGDWSAVKRVKVPMIGLALYLLSGTVAAILCQAAPDKAWDSLGIQLKIGLMALVTVTLLREAKHIKILAWVLVIGLGYLALVFNQYFVISHWNFIYKRGFGGIDNNGTAMIMVSGVPLAFFMGIHAKKLWVKALCFFAVILMAHVVLFSFSRGGQLGLCLVGASIFFMALFMLPRKILTVCVAIIFVAMTLRLAGEEVRHRFFTVFAEEGERDKSAESRFVSWSAAWKCMKEHPLGVGPRNFNKVAPRYGLGEGKSVHNLYLQTGADYGFLGMFGLGLFYVGSMWTTFQMARTPEAKRLVWPRYFGHMVCVSLGGFLFCSMFIGMETVEIAYMVSLLGLATASYVKGLDTEDAPALKYTAHVHDESADSVWDGDATPAPR